MQEVNFDEAFELIRAKDPRYQREAYQFVREALDYTQRKTTRDGRRRIRHVTGQELLAGIREYALEQYGPMAISVFEEWGIRCCQDFGEIVFNMVEAPGAATFKASDFKDPLSFVAKLKQQSDPVSQFLWGQFSEPARREALKGNGGQVFEALLAQELNQIIQTEALYRADRFAAVTLSNQAKSMLDQPLQGVQLARLNRLLLEEAYPLDIARSQGLLAKTEKDSRADFAGGYDFWEAFRKPFLPSKKQTPQVREPNTARA